MLRAALNGPIIKMEDPEGPHEAVANLLEKLLSQSCTGGEKEQITHELLNLAKNAKDGQKSICSHSQAIPLLLTLLKSGTVSSKINVATILACLCRDEDLRVKVLLGGCIPPLLGLLKNESVEARKAAAEAIYALSHGSPADQVGSKIFVTESVVPCLWEQLRSNSQEKLVGGLLTGALRNLFSDTERFLQATLKADGVEILVKLLLSGNSNAQANASFLLANLILASDACSVKVFSSGAVKFLLNLMNPDKEITICAEAAGALRAISSKLDAAKASLVDAGGIQVLIRAISSSANDSCKEAAQTLQENCIRTLANIYGGMSPVALSLAEAVRSSSNDSQLAEAVGALGYALKVFSEPNAGDVLDLLELESLLIKQLKPFMPKLVKKHIFEALSSLYNNACLREHLSQSGTKGLLCGLVTLTDTDVQEELISSLKIISLANSDIWEAINGRYGVQLFISLLGLSTPLQQEYAVGLLSIISEEVDEGKWAITAAGGIPPLVQLLESGSDKAKAGAAIVLRNLSSHSEDIRACVYSAEAVPALIHLLGKSNLEGQKIAAEALKHLVRDAHPSTFDRLRVLLLGDLPESKVYVLEVCSFMISLASYEDLVLEGTAAQKCFKTVLQMLSSCDEVAQENAASLLADVFDARQDICKGFGGPEIIASLCALLKYGTGQIVLQSARALSVLFTSIESNRHMAFIANDIIISLFNLAKSSSIHAAEVGVTALANLCLDKQVATEALTDEIVPALTRVLMEGSEKGKFHAAVVVCRFVQHGLVDDSFIKNIHRHGTAISLVSVLSSSETMAELTAQALEALLLLSKLNHEETSRYLLWTPLIEGKQSLDPFILCLTCEIPYIQEKTIKVLSRLCSNLANPLGEMLAESPQGVYALGFCVIQSTSLEAKIGASSLLICGIKNKEHREKTLTYLNQFGILIHVIKSLVQMIKLSLGDSGLGFGDLEEFNQETLKIPFHTIAENRQPHTVLDLAFSIGGTIATWLLCLIASHDKECKVNIEESGAVGVLNNKLENLCSSQDEAKSEAWVSALLLAILFQDKNVVDKTYTPPVISSLALMFRSDNYMERYFVAQALAGLVSNGSKETIIKIANSGVCADLISLLGNVGSDMVSCNLLSEAFSLAHNPDQVVLEKLFQVNEIRGGAVARRCIPLLVELLKPMADRQGSPALALAILIQIANCNDGNRLVMAEAGVVESVTKYLSLGLQGPTEEACAEFLYVLFQNAELRQHDAVMGAVNELIAVIQMGSRNARYNAMRALARVFETQRIKCSDAAKRVIKPLLDCIDAGGTEAEQIAALSALVKLSDDNPSKAAAIVEAAEGNAAASVSAVDCLHRILVAPCSLQLKQCAAHLCRNLFSISKARITASASKCIEPLVELLSLDSMTVQEAAACALATILEEEQLAETASDCGALLPLVQIIAHAGDSLLEAALTCLIKMARFQPHCRHEMMKAGVIENALESFSEMPDELCSTVAELFRILTESSSIAKSAAAARLVEPMFMALSRPRLNTWGQQNVLQTIVNIMSKSRNRSALKLGPDQAIEPLICFLESSSSMVQELAAELLALVLGDSEYFERDVLTRRAVIPLVQLADGGIQSLQEKAIKALETVSLSWPNAVADAGGIAQLSKVILQQTDPKPTHKLWESAALVLSNIFRFSSQYYFKVGLPVLVKMLRSNSEETVTTALSALVVLERDDAASGEKMADAGAVKALLDLLKFHQCEEAAARLLEALFNNSKVRDMKIAKYAIAGLSEYLLDPQTRKEEPARLLVALALGDLFQHDGLARTGDSASACRALVSVLEDEPSDDMQMVALCALQSLVSNSRTNRRAVAEAGGIQVVQHFLDSPNSDISAQAALLMKLLFSSHVLRDYVSIELIHSLTAALDKDLWKKGSVNEDIVKAINVIFSNFSKFRGTEVATVCIQHLIGALKAGSESAQAAALDALCLLKDSWASIPADVGKAQAIAAAESIPILQLFIKSGPEKFHEKAESLLACLPGTLVVTLKKGNNLKQALGSTNAFCKLCFGNGPPRETKVIPQTNFPEWKQEFAWAFDVPPKGQKLNITCKSKNTFGKVLIGRVTIQIDRVVLLGSISGQYPLVPEHNRDGTSRSLEIEFQWSNR